MGRGLYKATVTMDIEVLLSADEQPDERQVLEAAHDEFRENWSPFDPVRCGDVGQVVHVTRLEQLPECWRQATPWGDPNDGRTCLQVLEAYIPEREPLGEQQELEMLRAVALTVRNSETKVGR